MAKMAHEHLRGKRILIVDDNAAIAYRLRLNFEALGCDVVIAQDVKTAEAATDIDLAVVDMYLPEVYGVMDVVMRGEQLCYTLRRKMPKLRIIAITEYLDSPPHSPLERTIDTFLPKDYIPTGKTPTVLLDAAERLLAPRNEQKPQMFIVHAHNNPIALELKNYLQNTLNLGEPILLRERAGSGRALIEMFEAEAHLVDVVFVIATPDDIIKARHPTKQPRGNVLFELGYFYARLRRTSGRIIVLRKGEVELPSDLSGIKYIDINSGVGAASDEIRRELNTWLA